MGGVKVRILPQYFQLRRTDVRGDGAVAYVNPSSIVRASMGSRVYLTAVRARHVIYHLVMRAIHGPPLDDL